jgi:hypothetical protein
VTRRSRPILWASKHCFDAIVLSRIEYASRPWFRLVHLSNLSVAFMLIFDTSPGTASARLHIAFNKFAARYFIGQVPNSHNCMHTSTTACEEKRCRRQRYSLFSCRSRQILVEVTRHERLPNVQQLSAMRFTNRRIWKEIYTVVWFCMRTSFVVNRLSLLFNLSVPYVIVFNVCFVECVFWLRTVR